MNIKNIVKSQAVRHKLLKLFSWLPDRIMLPMQYYMILHRRLNLKSPERFTEKIQCYKAFYRNEEMLKCTDKYLVREYVKIKLGTDKYLNTIYQVCKNADDIDFDSLPSSFVIKTTDGGNGDNVYICKDKASIDKVHVTNLVNSWRSKKYYSISREWAYNGARDSKVIVEQFLSDTNDELLDYKMFCFNGKVEFFKVDFDRYKNHRANYYDLNMNILPFEEAEYPSDEGRAFCKPKNFDIMIEIAEKLSESFPFVRVDLYNIDGEIYFGEMTFYPGSGYSRFIPDSADLEIGKLFTYSF